MNLAPPGPPEIFLAGLQLSPRPLEFDQVVQAPKPDQGVRGVVAKLGQVQVCRADPGRQFSQGAVVRVTPFPV